MECILFSFMLMFSKHSMFLAIFSIGPAPCHSDFYQDLGRWSKMAPPRPQGTDVIAEAQEAQKAVPAQETG